MVTPGGKKDQGPNSPLILFKVAIGQVKIYYFPKTSKCRVPSICGYDII